MTGYGRSSGESAGLRVGVEIRGVNNKGLDVRLYLPPYLTYAEQAGREAVRRVINRGRVEVRVTLSVVNREAIDVKLSQGTASALAELAASMESDGKLARGLTFSDLLAVPDAVRVGIRRDAEEGAEHLLLSVLDVALSEFSESRLSEGERIKRQFDEACARLNGLLERAKAAATEQVPAIRERLGKRVATLGITVDPGRIEQEVALAADRSDVAEEQVRLGSHLEAMTSLLAKGADALGKRLDHLLQEMQREISTMLAKSDIMELTKTGLEMKLIVEQLREQVLNVA